ncbi:sarcosine oxidase subunit gamma [Saccharopolyspora tripterygii]
MVAAPLPHPPAGEPGGGEVRRGVLADRAAELAEVLTEEPLLSQLDLRTDAEFALGFRLPRTNLVTGGEHRAALGLGPDEYLLIGVVGTEPGHRSAVDVSAARTSLRLSDRNALQSLCALDLHPRAFAPGTCAQTRLARVPVILWRLGTDYRVLVSSSYAGHVATALLGARQATPGVAQ